MFSSIINLVRPAPQQVLRSIPPGERVYAIGDIHGRLDLFEALTAAITADDAARGDAFTTIILLGDLIDRGPDSAGVIAAAQQLARSGRLRIICGNHEEMLLACLDDSQVIPHFLRYGGRETLLSYPVPREMLDTMPPDILRQLMRVAIPRADVAFIRSFEDYVAIGDYLFVHAGIVPGRAMEEQNPADLRWIREPFLSHRGDHGCIVVHGHTITEQPDFRPNRIGIDTGAYMGGRLTALGLEGIDQWVIEASESAEGIEVAALLL